MPTSPRFDVVGLGEVMLRLSVPTGERLDDARRLAVEYDPQVRAARQKYGSEVEFLGVNVTVNQRLERVKRHLAEAPPPYRALWDDQGVAVRAYDVPSTSYVVIVDKQGKVAYAGVGKDQDLAAVFRKVVGR